MIITILLICFCVWFLTPLRSPSNSQMVEAPLITRDQRIAAAPGHSAAIEVVLSGWQLQKCGHRRPLPRCVCGEPRLKRQLEQTALVRDLGSSHSGGVAV
jgi:hypothetical protein